jgi:enoyl-[acyl-carrier protein] reductase I
MYNLLKGKRGIIFGALNSNSIAWKVAERAHQEGATFTLTNTALALRLGELNALSESTNSKIIEADVTVMEDLHNLFTQTQEILGGKIDFILHSVGMSPNIRKNRPYMEMDYNFYQKTLDISALSLHKVLHTAYKLDALNDEASVIALTYIAAQRTFPDYTDMAEAKAMLESIVRSSGFHLGNHKKVRVNSISQSPTATTAGNGVSGFDAFIDYAEQMSPLGNASADECADYCVVMFSDLTKKVTMQNLFHDGGFSNTGVSKTVMNKFGEL